MISRQLTIKYHFNKSSKLYNSKAGKMHWVYFVLAALLVVGVVFFLSRSDSLKEIEIRGHEWQRTIVLAQYSLVEAEGWADEVPEGSEIISETDMVREYRKIPDGFEDVEESYEDESSWNSENDENDQHNSVATESMGDGDSTRTRTVIRQKFIEEPVYCIRTKYRHKTWVELEPLIASGADHSPFWPSADTKKSSPVEIGDIKEISRDELYTVEAVELGSGNSFQIKSIQRQPLSFEQFSRLKKNSRWKARFGILGALQEIPELASE